MGEFVTGSSHVSCWGLVGDIPCESRCETALQLGWCDWKLLGSWSEGRFAALQMGESLWDCWWWINKNIPKKKTAWIRWMVYPNKKIEEWEKNHHEIFHSCPVPWQLFFRKKKNHRSHWLGALSCRRHFFTCPWHRVLGACHVVQWSCWRCEDQSPLEIFDATVNALTTFGLMVEVLSESNFRST